MMPMCPASCPYRLIGFFPWFNQRIRDIAVFLPLCEVRADILDHLLLSGEVVGRDGAEFVFVGFLFWLLASPLNAVETLLENVVGAGDKIPTF